MPRSLKEFSSRAMVLVKSPCFTIKCKLLTCLSCCWSNQTFVWLAVSVCYITMNSLARQANTCALFSGWLLFSLSKTRNLMYETKKIQQDTRLPRCILGSSKKLSAGFQLPAWRNFVKATPVVLNFSELRHSRIYQTKILQVTSKDASSFCFCYPR